MTPAFYRLMAWLSPSYPVGAFSYSHGLETAVDDGRVVDAATLTAWIEAILVHGAGRSDGALFAAAGRAAAAEDDHALTEVCELAAAFQPGAEIALESTAQGAAFLTATLAAWPAPALERLAALWPGDAARPLAYPVAVAVACAGHGVPLGLGLGAYLQAFAANLVSAGVRLVPLGQSDGQRAIAALAPAVTATAESAPDIALEDLGGCTPLADICALRHETQYTRLFRS